MASAAAIDPAARVHFLDDADVRTGLPFLERWLVRSGVASAANCRGNFKARAGRWIIRVGGVIAGRPVAILALNALQLRSRRRAAKPARVAVSNRMTRQAARIAVLMDLLEGRKGLGVLRAHHCVVDALMTFNTRLRADVVRRRTQDAEQRIGRRASHECSPH